MHNQNMEQIETILRSIPNQSLVEIHHILCDDKKIMKKHSHPLKSGKGQNETYLIFPGVTVSRMHFIADEICACHHASSPSMLEINYCHSGRIGWNMKNGQSIYLGPGDFSINTQALCADSVMTLPNSYYEGIVICIDMSIINEHLPEIVCDANISFPAICDKFCPQNSFSILTGNENTASIFEGFLIDEDRYRPAYFSIKTLELILYLMRTEKAADIQRSQYQSEQVEIIKNIHDYLIENMDQRITIDSLANKFLLNTTTIKTVFKAVYGDSIASHTREHRMEHAAKLLSLTDDSIAQIAQSVGYNSQSKFSAAFQEAYQILPLEYRKLHNQRG